MRFIERSWNQRGVTLIELLVAVLVSTIVLIAIGSFYVRMQDSYSQGNIQSVIQRQGTLTQEEMGRIIQAASALLAGNCGPTSVSGDSLSVQVPADVLPDSSLNAGGFVCFYLSSNQIAECRFASTASRGCIAGTTRNLIGGLPIPQTLLGGRQTVPPTELSSVTTRNVFTLAGGSSVEIAFRLATGSLTAPMIGPLDFTTRVTVRNG